jgi:hypothetical protein
VGSKDFWLRSYAGLAVILLVLSLPAYRLAVAVDVDPALGALLMGSFIAMVRSILAKLL